MITYFSQIYYSAVKRLILFQYSKQLFLENLAQSWIYESSVLGLHQTFQETSISGRPIRELLCIDEKFGCILVIIFKFLVVFLMGIVGKTICKFPSEEYFFQIIRKKKLEKYQNQVVILQNRKLETMPNKIVDWKVIFCSGCEHSYRNPTRCLLS